MNMLNTDSPPPPDELPHDLVVRSETREVALTGEARALVNAVLMTVRRDQREAMKVLALELRAITNDNSVLRHNLALLNEGMADFQREQVIPLRSELANLREEQGGRTIENARKLEALIQALTRSMTLANITIPQDLKDQIADGHFEDLDHRKANDATGDEIRGYVPEQLVQSMIDAAVRKALTQRGIHEATSNDGDLQKSDA
jgi:hypothetical protein